MTVDVEIKFAPNIINKVKTEFDTITYDEDYCENIEDVIDWVDEELYQKYSFPISYERGDYDIENLDDIENEMLKKSIDNEHDEDDNADIFFDRNLNKLNGDMVRDWYNYLNENNEGCCHIDFGETEDGYFYSICMGWTKAYDNWKIAWKIGRQKINNAMQTDLDIDFEMPYDSNGDVYDTLEVVNKDTDWDSLAEEMKSAAYKIWDERSEFYRVS